MPEKQFSDLTVKEICNYIAIMNKLVAEGIIKFDKKIAYAEICVDEATIYLEKQNVRLKEKIDKVDKDIQKLLDDINTKTIIGLNSFIPRLEIIQDELVGE